MSKGKIEQFILEKSGLEPPEPPIEKFKRLAQELKDKFERDTKIHEKLIAKSTHPLPFLDMPSFMMVKNLLRFVDTLTGEHYEMIRARLKRTGKKAIGQAEQFNQEYANLMERVLETANGIYFGFDKFKNAVQDLQNFEAKLFTGETEPETGEIEPEKTETEAR